MVPGQAGTAAEYQNEEDYESRRRVREDARIADEVLDATMPQRSADAARVTPRTIEEAANPNMSRALPDSDTIRKRMTSRRKKDLARQKGAWIGALPKTRFGAVKAVTEKAERLEDLNQLLVRTTGNPHDPSVPPGAQRAIRQLDLAIQDQERVNEREHLVYAPAYAPFEAGSSREAYLRRIQDAIDEDSSLEFDRYIVADHSMANLEDDHGAEIAFEIKTRSGAYLGSSDTLPDATHLLPRGRVLKPTGIQRDVPYIKADGSTGYWGRVVQFEDITGA